MIAIISELKIVSIIRIILTPYKVPNIIKIGAINV